MTTCPKCDYKRQATDTAPDWQCPRCGVACAKVGSGGGASGGAAGGARSGSTGASRPLGTPLPEGQRGVAASVDWEGMRAIEVRRANVGHEAGVRSVGILYYLPAAFFLFGAGWVFLDSGTLHTGSTGAKLAVAGGFLFFALLFYAIGKGLRDLRNWASILVAIMAGVSALTALLINPTKNWVTLLLDFYVIWVMMSGKGRYVVTEDYHGVIEATPQIKPGLGLLTWLLIAMLVVVAGALAFAWMHDRSVNKPPVAAQKNMDRADVAVALTKIAQDIEKKKGQEVGTRGVYIYTAESHLLDLTASYTLATGSPIQLDSSMGKAALNLVSTQLICRDAVLLRAVELGGTETFILYSVAPSLSEHARIAVDKTTLSCPVPQQPG